MYAAISVLVGSVSAAALSCIISEINMMKSFLIINDVLMNGVYLAGRRAVQIKPTCSIMREINQCGRRLFD